MKKIAFLLFALFAVLSFSQVKWMTLEQAIAAQQEKPKKIFIDFYADWCGPCKIMDKNTYGHQEIANFLNENYYAVKFDAEGKESVTVFGRIFSNPEFSSGKKRNSMHDFTKFMNVNSVPSIVFLNEQSMPITNINGFLTAKELDPYLRIISSDEYKKFKSRAEWENYQRKMKSTIKE
ncbi:MAG TPA: thioredoxin family protein [Kaistella sp.]|uniref:thioredoxin family protein n=1 Tax=Candidatus Kaistella beijingensis TaxID=2820270 RepID=UPI001CC40FE4|nr:thioredoxin fold domain-containing protein [Candidatus Kaistella beijingensis]UBB90332.1 thioredoxin family protein [Candidatus Kaistella beijingensis]HMU07498.1 thioredoxin family protein [Kaistella sp.]